MLSSFNKGFLAIVGAVLFWSVNETVGSLVFQEGASPLTLLTMRFGIASLVVLAGLLLWRKTSFKIEKKHWGIMAIGTVIMTLHLIGFWQGIKSMNSIVMAVAIFYLFPFWTATLSAIFWKERFSKTGLASLIIGVIGALFALKCFPAISLSSVNWIGVGWMMLAGIGWSAYIMNNKKIADKYNPFTILLYNFAGATVIFCLLQSPIITFSELTVGVVIKTAFMAVTASCGAFMLFNYALKHIKATTASVANLSKMFFSVLAAYLILSQTVTLFQVLGVILIIIGIYLLIKDNERAN